MIRLLLVEFGIAREGLRCILEDHPIAVGGAADSPAKAISLAPHLSPDIILTEIRFPGSQHDYIEKLSEAYPRAKIIVILCPSIFPSCVTASRVVFRASSTNRTPCLHASRPPILFTPGASGSSILV
jgi:chemotaxis response regulator CheB